jgi:DNA-binding IclR family transcriptional regulator
MATNLLLRATETQLSGNTKCVLLDLARRADRHGITEVLSYQVLSESVGIGISTVHHAITRLLDLGYVVRVERVVKVGSRYQVLMTGTSRP